MVVVMVVVIAVAVMQLRLEGRRREGGREVLPAAEAAVLMMAEMK